jgi:hypothetical protein
VANLFDIGADPLQRRRRGEPDLDPFSDAARFPTLVHDQQNALRSAGVDIQAAAVADPNSIAGRFNPLDKGSIFSRQNPGLADALRDQQNDALQPRATSGPVRQPHDELSAVDRYAITTGYQTPADIAATQGASSIDKAAYDTQPAMRQNIAATEVLRRRRDPYGLFSDN